MIKINKIKILNRSYQSPTFVGCFCLFCLEQTGRLQYYCEKLIVINFYGYATCIKINNIGFEKSSRTLKINTKKISGYMKKYDNNK